MQKSLILFVFGSVIVFCVVAQSVSVQRPLRTAQSVSYLQTQTN